MSNQNYERLYKKYKLKYLTLKSQLKGGGFDLNKLVPVTVKDKVAAFTEMAKAQLEKNAEFQKAQRDLLEVKAKGEARVAQSVEKAVGAAITVGSKAVSEAAKVGVSAVNEAGNLSDKAVDMGTKIGEKAVEAGGVAGQAYVKTAAIGANVALEGSPLGTASRAADKIPIPKF